MSELCDGCGRPVADDGVNHEDPLDCVAWLQSQAMVERAAMEVVISNLRKTLHETHSALVKLTFFLEDAAK